MSSTDELMSALNFTLDDLNANKRGELSPRRCSSSDPRQAYHRRVQRHPPGHRSLSCFML
jgi:hypothetical protein